MLYKFISCSMLLSSGIKDGRKLSHVLCWENLLSFSNLNTAANVFFDQCSKHELQTKLINIFSYAENIRS